MLIKTKILIALSPFIVLVIFLTRDNSFAYENTKTQNLISFKSIENVGADNIIISPLKGVTCNESCSRNNVPPIIFGLASIIGSSNANDHSGDWPVLISSISFQFNQIFIYGFTIFFLILLLPYWYLRYTTGVSPPNLAQ